ncbi:MAG: hypothetical protein GY895_18600 [Phycisphaera sp.]|nr:hypothetical protein [Phycisphaera sp.]
MSRDNQRPAVECSLGAFTSGRRGDSDRPVGRIFFPGPRYRYFLAHVAFDFVASHRTAASAVVFGVARRLEG